eukprot:Platyproteum_vivax@DN4916_c0_g1_i2.p2
MLSMTVTMVFFDVAEHVVDKAIQRRSSILAANVDGLVKELLKQSNEKKQVSADKVLYCDQLKVCHYLEASKQKIKAILDKLWEMTSPEDRAILQTKFEIPEEASLDTKDADSISQVEFIQKLVKEKVAKVSKVAPIQAR